MRICHRNLHKKFQLSIFNCSRENHISPTALRTDGRADKVNYEVALLLNVDCGIFIVKLTENTKCQKAAFYKKNFLILRWSDFMMATP